MPIDWTTIDPDYIPISTIGENDGATALTIELPIPWIITDIIEDSVAAGGYRYKAQIAENFQEMFGIFGFKKYVFESETVDLYTNQWVVDQEYPALKVGYQFSVQAISFVVDGMFRSPGRDNAFVTKLNIIFGDNFVNILGKLNKDVQTNNISTEVLSKSLDDYLRGIGRL